MNPLATLRVIAHLAFSEATHALRQPRLMAQLFLLPIIFSTILAIFQTSEVAPARVLLTRPDTPLAAKLETRLRDLRLDVELADGRAQFLVARNDRDAWLVLPDDFDARLLHGKPSLEMRSPSNNSRALEVLGRVQSAIAEMQAPDIAALTAPNTDASSRTQKLLEEPFVTIQTLQTQVARSSNLLSAGGSNQTAPGMTLMFALLFGAQTGLSFQRERTLGTLSRLFSAPVSSMVIVLGKLLGNTVLLVLQLAAMVLFSSLALGVRWGNIGALVAPVLAFALCAASFGAMNAALTKTAAQLTALSVVLVNVLSALGGLWWPLDLTPTWMQQLAKFLPTYWGMQSLQSVILRGSGLDSVIVGTLILLGFALVFATVGSRAFKYE